MNRRQNQLIVIVGPTASGKSSLALRLAQEFNGEVVSADSRQLYRYLDIGTAKPSPAETALISHHLIDIINPEESFSLAQFQRLANETIVDIRKRGKTPLLVGGSGLYVWTLVEGWQIPEVAPDDDFRRNLESRAAQGEAEALFQELEQVDPIAAKRIDPRNVRRVIRALEIAQNPSAAHPRKGEPPFDTLILGLTAERKELYRRIDDRVDDMIKRGLFWEAHFLLEAGYDISLPSMSGIGYKQALRHIQGELSMADAVREIKTETHRLVRRQYNWFRLTDERIKWLDISDEDMEEKAAEMVKEFLTKN